MVGPKEKAMPGDPFGSLPHDPQELNLKSLPKYLCYKASLLKEKKGLVQLNIALITIFLTYLVISRFEVFELQKRLREKEYILAPGVIDFTPASPLSVTDSYVSDAVTDFLSDLGNVTAQNIDEQYARLSRFMSKDLKVKFEMETTDWLAQVKTEGISQVFSIKEKEIKTEQSGRYKVVALARAEFYGNHQYLGFEDQAVEMSLSLVPPREGQRWYLQIDSLSWSRADTFQTKNKLQESNQK